MADFKATFSTDSKFKASFKGNDASFGASFGNTQVVETGDYNNLINQPSVENVILQGNKTIDQIGVGTLTVQEIEKILYLD